MTYNFTYMWDLKNNKKKQTKQKQIRRYKEQAATVGREEAD